ncbi:hypothetical protein BJ956_002460 [Arthrobacter psychrochitiniphilus]|nr:hypothetical protein [Arthrobacter psychrochitiniphilus]
MNNGFRINTELLASHPTPKEPSSSITDPAKPCQRAESAVPVRNGSFLKDLLDTLFDTSGRALCVLVNN